MSSTTGSAHAADAATPPPAVALSPAFAASALALLLGLQPLTTDLYLPALPVLARDLAAPAAEVQQTMSALILAFGLSQLVWGPVADRFGRRPVLLAGLSLFIAATVGAALAPGIGWVIAWRVVQGATMSAAIVCARAMVRDLYAPHEGAHVMARALSGLGVIAIAAPVLGGVAVTVGGWRATMVLLAALAAALLAWVAWRLPETAARRRREATHLGPLAAQLMRALAHPSFRAWAMLVSCTYGAIFIYLSSATTVFIGVLGLAPWQAGLALAINSAAYIAGTVWCGHLLRRHGLARAPSFAAWCSLAGGLALGALAWAGVRSAWAVVAPMMVFAFGHGVHQPCGQAGAVGPFPHAAGTASALAGLVLALVAFGIGQGLGAALDGTARPMAYGIAGLSILTALVAWTVVRRHGEPPAAATSP